MNQSIAVQSIAAALVGILVVGCAGASEAPRTPARASKSWSLPPAGGAFTPAIDAWLKKEPQPLGPEPDPTEMMKAVEPGSKTGLLLEYYEHEGWPKLQDFTQLESTKTGIVETVDLTRIPHREDHFALNLSGFFMAPADGLYTFALASDDGSALYLHGKRVVDNDGGHAVRVRTGKALLEKGAHPIQVQFFEDDGGQHLELEVRLPDDSIHPMAGDLITH